MRDGEAIADPRVEKARFPVPTLSLASLPNRAKRPSCGEALSSPATLTVPRQGSGS
jgi:hypothetical protein